MKKRKKVRRRKPGRKLKLLKRLRIPRLSLEIELREKGYKNIAGLDEVGRGCLIGPIVAAAVILPSKRLYSLRDSKLLSEKEREKLAKKIKKQARAISYGIVSAKEIEKLGLSQAGLLVLKRAILNLKPKPDFLLVDFYKIPDLPFPQKAIKKGDSVCLSISAASILAKVFRDNLMEKLGKRYPGYFFEENKGYGTKEHLKALKKLGPCEIHRKNFGPVKGLK